MEYTRDIFSTQQNLLFFTETTIAHPRKQPQFHVGRTRDRAAYNIEAGSINIYIYTWKIWNDLFWEGLLVKATLVFLGSFIGCKDHHVQTWRIILLTSWGW